MRTEVLEYFVKLKKDPEKVERFIERVYRETKSTDFAVIADRVYDLVKQEAASMKEAAREKPPEAVLKGKDYTSLSENGMVDSEQW